MRAIYAPLAQSEEFKKILEYVFGEQTGHYQVTAVAYTVSKDHASDMYKVLDEDIFLSLERNKT